MDLQIDDRPSQNYDSRPVGARVDMLVLHYTGMRSGSAAIDRLCDPAAKVSSHYLVEEDGRVLRLVPEDRRAWHAGVSDWEGDADVNSRSVGVEIVNPGHEFGYRPFPDTQMRSVIALCRGVLARHPIPPSGVVGHSDVAPLRKRDPGERFDWPRLARSGVGVWPDAGRLRGLRLAPDRTTALVLLRRIGYGLRIGPAHNALSRAAVVAFQRRFRPRRLTGSIDSDTYRRIVAVAEALERIRCRAR